MRSVSLLLLLVLAACGAAVPSASLVESGPAEVIEGLDGEAFIETLEEGAGPGLECDRPEPVVDTLQRWRCAEEREYTWEVIILGESLSAIHSVNASVADASGGGPDYGRAAGFLSWVAESARFTGGDPAAARDWIIENARTESIQLELPGVTYNLRGSPDEPRALEIVATD